MSQAVMVRNVPATTETGSLEEQSPREAAHVLHAALLQTFPLPVSDLAMQITAEYLIDLMGPLAGLSTDDVQLAPANLAEGCLIPERLVDAGTLVLAYVYWDWQLPGDQRRMITQVLRAFVAGHSVIATLNRLLASR